jgi:arylsulfatase A-like enzyme
MGEHRLTGGKMTAFDTDIRVPLIVVGPGVPAGVKTGALASNIDLAPTFMRLGGVRPPTSVDGQALVDLLHGPAPADWRNAVLIEHHHPETPNGDPDRQTAPSGTPPSYAALRSRIGTYVEYGDGEREYYDRRTDPDQLHNVYDSLTEPERAELHDWLTRLRDCRGAGCRAAALG